MKIDLDLIEMMYFFWQSIKEKEKVSEAFILEVANHPHFKILFNEEFNELSIQKVLSAISNKELLSDNTKAEATFWNNNLWMCEDLEVTKMMIEPLKTFHSDPNSKKTLVVIPGLKETLIITNNMIYLNFFKVMVDLFNGTNEVTINNIKISDYLRTL